MDKSIQSAKARKLLFYISLIIYPVIQFCLFYIYVNFNSIMLAFKEYYVDANGLLQFRPAGLTNLINAYTDLFTTELFLSCLKNSFIFYVVSIAGGTVCSLSFSYYIYKKGFLGGFFKVMLYVPHIISGLVITIMYKFLSQYTIPDLGEVFGLEITNLFGQGAYNEWTLYLIIFYNFVMSFGSNMLIYTGTMAGISDSVIEAAQIDGVNSWQEFIHVIMPSIFSTFSLFIVTGMITIFNGQGGLFNFFGESAPTWIQTFGYYLYVEVKKAGINYKYYPPLASLGFALTSFAIPIIFTGRLLLKKYGPSED